MEKACFGRINKVKSCNESFDFKHMKVRRSRFVGHVHVELLLEENFEAFDAIESNELAAIFLSVDSEDQSSITSGVLPGASRRS